MAATTLASGCHTTGRGVLPGLGDYEKQLLLFAEASSETAGPFLSLNPDASTTGGFAASSDPLSGVKAAAGAATGTSAPLVTQFVLTPALERAYYLNVSKPVQGTLYWQSQVSSLAAREAAQLRLELFVGAVRVGGDEYAWNPTFASQPWAAFPFRFRSEVLALHPGDALTLKVTRFGSLADFRIGTHGDQQSFIEIRYFEFDPLANAGYVEDGQYVTTTQPEETSPFLVRAAQAIRDHPRTEARPGVVVLKPPPEPEDSRDATLGLGAVAALPAVGLLAGRRGRRGALAPFLALALLAVAFSGCFGGGRTSANGATPSDGLSPTGSTSYIDDEDLQERGIGAIEGSVRDEIGLAIEGAHASILGTNLFVKTDSKGRFEFSNVSAKSYILRVEAEGFLVFEQTVDVQVGRITKLAITLARPGTKENPNSAQHTHDAWGDQVALPLYSVEFLPRTCTWGTSADTPGAVGTSVGVSDHAARCESPLPIDALTPVPPGTSSVEITLEWTPSNNAAKEFGLRVKTTTNRADDQHFVPRPAGDPFRVAILPQEADPGHQRFTQWEFFLEWPSAESYFPAGPLVQTAAKVKATIIAHKGVVPFEPAHRDFWAGRSEIPIFEAAPLADSCLECDLPNPSYGWNLPKGLFIPPGTAEIKGVMKWTHDYVPTGGLTAWRLAYRPANVPSATYTWKSAEGTGSGTSFAFSFRPEPAEVDQFYQVASNWFWSPDDGAAPFQGTTASQPDGDYGTRWSLTLSVIKDPTYRDT